MKQRQLAFLQGLQDGMEKFAIGQAQIARIQEAVSRMSPKDITAASKRNIDPVSTKEVLRGMRPGATDRLTREDERFSMQLAQQRARRNPQRAVTPPREFSPLGPSPNAPTYETLQQFIPGPSMSWGGTVGARLTTPEQLDLKGQLRNEALAILRQGGIPSTAAPYMPKAGLQEAITQLQRVLKTGPSQLFRAGVTRTAYKKRLVALQRQLQNQELASQKNPMSALSKLPALSAKGREHVQGAIGMSHDIFGLKGDLDVADKTMASGRHKPTDVVTLPQVTPANVAKQVGVSPERVMYKGGVPRGETANPTTPLWFSGSPSVSGGYAQNMPGGILQAYQTHPAARWTPHVAKDTFNMTRAELAKTRARAAKGGGRLAGNSPVGAWKNYETVAPSGVVGEPIASYKPMATPGKFMMTKGVLNPLGGDLE